MEPGGDRAEEAARPGGQGSSPGGGWRCDTGTLPPSNRNPTEDGQNSELQHEHYILCILNTDNINHHRDSCLIHGLMDCLQ